ncbi:MAG TPA: TIGR02594 family protein [Polyangiaceae bacterium]|nr:TIGR02594 family protein [Polyangiaceae bacterium]
MASEAVRTIQRALKDKGFEPGPVDGIWGRATVAAVIRFQAANRLTPDGVVGPATRAALFAEATPAAPPSAAVSATVLPWFEEAKHLVGTKEVLGPKSNPTILDWATSLDIHYAGDDIPWCGLFVSHCVGATLPQEGLPGNPLGARQWARFGDSSTARTGAIMVFWRESPASGKGHVGFYVGEDETAYQILGGNQSDSVCLTWLDKKRLLAARWPKGASSLVTSSLRKRRDEGLSSNEA